jgi:hypothetical protein
MAKDDDEIQGAVAAYPRKSERNLAVDRTATIVLLAVHAFLVAVTIGVLSLLVMGTDPCGSQTRLPEFVGIFGGSLARLCW